MRTGIACTRYVFAIDRADGRRVWLRGSCALLNPADAENSPVVASFSDITDQRTATERLAYEATHDSLTGLPNRGQVLRRAMDALGPGRADRLAAVLFIDLDRLKQTNDSLGHSVGDRVLQAAASRLRATVRREDMVGRLGGDEFVALLFGEISAADVDLLADRLRGTLAEPVAVGTGRCPPAARASASCWWTGRPPHRRRPAARRRPRDVRGQGGRAPLMTGHPLSWPPCSSSD